MLAALQRDLGLSRAQVEARLLNEARLAPVEARLRAMLGGHFAGSWLAGTTAQTLVVATAADADVPRIRAAGAQAAVVSASLATLKAVKQRLDDTLPVRPIGGSARYVDVRTNKVVVLSKRAPATRNAIESIGVDTAEVDVVASVEKPRPFHDVRGGDAYHIGTTGRCSIGFSVTRGPRNGFVTAGHCGRKGDTTTGFNRVAQGVFQASTFPGSDFAWVAVNGDWTPRATVRNGAAGAAAATTGGVSVAGDKVAIEGTSVCRSGSTTGWRCGTILQRDASAVYPTGKTFGLTRTDVCSERGDSGGSFISIDQAQGVTSGGSGDCTTRGTTYFQPIREILTTYGLSLVTAAPPASGSAALIGGTR